MIFDIEVNSSSKTFAKTELLKLRKLKEPKSLKSNGLEMNLKCGMEVHLPAKTSDNMGFIGNSYGKNKFS